MLGKKYDITNADISGTKVTLDLMGGAIRDTLEQGETKTYTLNGKDYEVTVTFIGSVSGASKVKMQINDEVTDAMAENDIYKLEDETEVSIKEILEEEAGEVTADQVEFYLGAEKLTLVDPVFTTVGYGDANSDNVRLSDEDVDDLYVDIDASWSSDKLKIDKIVFTWLTDDEIFVAEDSEVTFPGLGSFKVSYQGFTTEGTEEVKIGPHGDNVIELTIPLETGTVTFDLINGSGQNFTSVGGEDYTLGTCASGSGVVIYDMDTMEFFVATNNAARESYLLKVTRIDDEDGITIKDQGSGDYYRDLAAGAHSIGEVTLTVGNFSQETLNVSLTNSDATYGCSFLYTATGLAVVMPVVDAGPPLVHPEVGRGANCSTTYELAFIEEDKDENLRAGSGFNITLGWTSDKAEVKTISGTPFSSSNMYEIGDTEEYVGYIASDLATKVVEDRDPDQDTVTITYHDVQAYANAYLSEITTTFRSGEAATGVTVIEKIEVGTAKLASEIANVAAQNLLLVGGPCANKAASDVMGFTSFPDPDCAADFTEGKAKIKLYDTGAGKIAMLVAGYSAADTRRASKVVAEYDKYALSGSEMEVTGTSMTDITVTSVS